MKDPQPGTDQGLSSDIINAVGKLPPCFTNMKAHLVNYTPQREVTISMPVEESYLNPAGSMQGGFITAAFDNVFGFLCSLVTDNANSVTLNINTNYHRPIFLGDEIIITATIKSLGRTMVHLTAEGYDRKGKLIATSSSTYMLKGASA